MYFIASKVLLFLLLPVYWVVILLFVALIVKDRKRKQRVLLAAIIVLYLFSIPLFVNVMEKAWDVKPYPANSNEKYSCVIVLGGFSSGSEKNNGHFNGNSDRFIQGVKLIATRQASHILISGGNGLLAPGGFREATWAKTQLEQLNIPDSLILTESNSKNTLENARFSKTILENSHLPPPYLLVTSAFHMRRSLMIFKKAGLNVVAYPCNYFTSDASFIISDIMPDANTLFTWEYYIKEVVGYMVNYFK